MAAVRPKSESATGRTGGPLTLRIVHRGLVPAEKKGGEGWTRSRQTRLFRLPDSNTSKRDHVGNAGE